MVTGHRLTKPGNQKKVQNKDQATKPSLFAGFLITLGMWVLLSLFLNRPIVPTPWVVVRVIWLDLVRGSLLLDAGASLSRVLIGCLLSVLIGLPLGLVAGRTAFGKQLVLPTVYFLYPIPKIAFLPVLLVLFGLGEGSKLVLITLVIVFQMVIPVADQVQRISPDLFLAARFMGLQGVRLYYHLIIPAVLPTVVSSLKLAGGIGFSVLFFAENYATRYGLGALVMNAWIMADYPGMYVGIVMLGVLGISLFTVLDWLGEIVIKG
jgi:NitT/TauT family transport system permease protein